MRCVRRIGRRGIAALLALPLGVCLAASAQAEPASSGEVDRLLQALGMSADSPHISRAVEGRIDALAQEMPELTRVIDLDCMQRDMQAAVHEALARSVIDGLGDDGEQWVAQWNHFVQTRVGKLVALGGADLDAATLKAAIAGASAQERQAAEDFLASPAVPALSRALAEAGNVDAAMDEGLSEIPEQCLIATSNERS